MGKNNKIESDHQSGASVESDEKEEMRLDAFLVKRGLAQSRERAKAMIHEGNVLVNGRLITRASAAFSSDAEIEVKKDDIPWVSRAGLKLEYALEQWPVSVEGKKCLDIGASTGGFTDVLLRHGAKRVYALDVGHGQLAKKLRDDQRVISMEKQNIRNVEVDMFPESPEVITADVSFISLTHVLPKIADILSNGGEAIVLVKPQFEVGKKDIRKGVVRDPLLHERVLQEIHECAVQLGFDVLGVTESPILGIGGNKEFIMHVRKSEDK